MEDIIQVNIFDKTCAHHVRDLGYFTSTEGRKPKKIQFVHDQNPYDGITLFTDNCILGDVNSVVSPIKIAWCLESPAVMSHVHNNIHLVAHKFDYVLTYRDDLIVADSKKFIPNSPGGSFILDGDISLYTSVKSKGVSMVVSGKQAYEGHVLRHQLLRNAQGLDCFGWGTSNGYLDNKIGALKEYMFHMVIENTRCPHYFTEKLIDSLVTGCVPVYWGAQNIERYFNVDGFVIFNSLEELSGIKLSKALYESKKQAVEENFHLAKKYLSSDDHMASKIVELLKDKV